MHTRVVGRWKRHRRLRKKVIGLPERPRLCVSRSQQYLYAQLIDDQAGKTLLGWSTNDERLKSLASRKSMEAAKALGALIAADASKKGIHCIVFDRGGFLFHGRVKALADAVREGGIQV